MCVQFSRIRRWLTSSFNMSGLELSYHCLLYSPLLSSTRDRPGSRHSSSSRCWGSWTGTGSWAAAPAASEPGSCGRSRSVTGRWISARINWSCVCTVQGLWFHGSPSICMGNCFLVLITTWLHCASRLPLDRSPVRTWTNQRWGLGSRDPPPPITAHLAHVEAVLQPHHLYQLVPDVLVGAAQLRPLLLSVRTPPWLLPVLPEHDRCNLPHNDGHGLAWSWRCCRPTCWCRRACSGCWAARSPAAACPPSAAAACRHTKQQKIFRYI